MSALGGKRTPTVGSMLFLTRFLCALFAICGASEASATSDSQLWITTGATVKLSDSWRLSEEVTTRLSDHRNGLYEIEIDTLIGYRVGKAATVWAGYTHDPQYSGGNHTTTEHRAREQITFDNFAKIGPGYLSARFRAEQRWRDNADGTGFRLRPFLRYTIPFHEGGRTGLTLTTEPFVNLNTTSFQAKPGLDRIRNLVAITAPIGEHLTGEFGYMNQHIFISNGPDESDNIAWLSLKASF